MAGEGHAVLMFGYEDQPYNKCFRLKDSEIQNERRIPFWYPTIEQVRTELQNGIDAMDVMDFFQIAPNYFVLADTGYVVKFVSV